MHKHLIETFNAIVYFEIFSYNEFRFDVAILLSNSKIFFRIFWIVINANLNIFIILMFVLIKKIFKENKNFFIYFIHKIINMWTFDFVVQSSADIINVVIFVKKKSHDVNMNKIHFSTIKDNIIIMIFKSFNIASAWYTYVL